MTDGAPRSRTLIAGTGSWVPEAVMTAGEIEAARGLKPGFVTSRLGIPERRVAAPEVFTWTMGARAATAALEDADVAPDDVDLVLFHTTAPETLYPTPGVWVQRAIGITRDVPVLEVKAACAAFVAMLQVGDAMIRAGSASTVLVVCAEKLYPVAPLYEATAPLFGDGAAAAVLRGGGGEDGLLWSRTWTDGDGAMACMSTTPVHDLRDPAEFPGGGDLDPVVAEWAERDPPGRGLLAHWDGMKVFRSAVRRMGAAIGEALDGAGLTSDDVAHFLVHQANGKILASVLRQYDLPPERTPSNIARYGNTSSATVPILLDEGRRAGRIRPGEVVLMVAFGAGFTWGAAVCRVT